MLQYLTKATYITMSTKTTTQRFLSFPLLFCYLLSILAIGGCFYTYFQLNGQKKIAYVRSGDLIYGFQGMKEAQDTFKLKTVVWKANIDTLQAEFNRSLEIYDRSYRQYSSVERTQQQEEIRTQQENLERFRTAIQAQSQEEQTKITEGVLNQINSFVADYGKEHGYDLILGTTVSGNIMYGTDYIDITDEVLKELNNYYKGVKEQ